VEIVAGRVVVDIGGGVHAEFSSFVRLLCDGSSRCSSGSVVGGGGSIRSSSLR